MKQSNPATKRPKYSLIRDQYADTGNLDMANIEEGLLCALMHDGCKILEYFFKQHIPDCADQCKKGERHYRRRHIKIHSVLGKFSLWRDYFYNGKGGRTPLEEQLGCIFTQLCTVEGELPDRDPDSTTYVASFEPSVKFGGIIRQEAMQRGMAKAKEVVALGDGAPWIWEIARINFPNATCILDLYHAYEHVNDLATLIYPNESAESGHAKKMA